MTLIATTILNSSGSALTLSNTVDGPNNLTLTAGAGNITLSATVGGITPVGTLLFNTANNVTAAAISAASIQQNSSSGTTHFTGPLNTNSINGIALVGTNYTFDQTVTTTNSGALSITHTGLLTLNAAANINLSGAFREAGGGPVQTAANITTNDENITWAGPILLTGPVTLNAGPGIVGNITFNNTVDGPYCLTLITGTGDTIFNAPVGSIVPLGCLAATAAEIFQNTQVITNGTLNYTGLS